MFVLLSFEHNTKDTGDFASLFFFLHAFKPANQQLAKVLVYFGVFWKMWSQRQLQKS